MEFLHETFSKQSAITTDDQTLSFAELRHQINQCAIQLKKLPKALLLLNAEPNVTFITQFLAALSIGQPLALLSSQWSAEDRQARLATLGSIMTVNAQGALEEFHEHRSRSYHPLLALMLFTSGSSGQVKAVQLSRSNIEANCQAVIKALRFATVQDQLLFLPLSYSFGLLGQLLPGLMSGIDTRIISHFTAIKILLETGDVPQMWSGVPSHWVAIHKIAASYPDSSQKIRSVISAGSALPVSLRARLQQIFPNAIIYNNYGLTEASPRVLTYSSEDPLFMQDYAGYAIGDWQLKLSEDQELLIQGRQIMLGYLGEDMPQNTWLATGDLAEMTSSGLVKIKGRKDDMINIAGKKVFLNEIEQKISRINGINEVVVQPVPDPVYGVRLQVFLDKSTLASSDTEQSLTEKIQLCLLPEKVPFTLQLIDKMPHNQHGKLDRKKLLYAKEYHDHR